MLLLVSDLIALVAPYLITLFKFDGFCTYAVECTPVWVVYGVILEI